MHELLFELITVYNFYIFLNGFCVAKFVGYPIWCTCGIFLLLCCFYVIWLWLNSAIIYMLGLLSFVSFFREGGGRSRFHKHINCCYHRLSVYDWLILLLSTCSKELNRFSCWRHCTYESAGFFYIVFFLFALSIMIYIDYFEANINSFLV